MSDHALFSPSAAHRWMRCPGSIKMEEPFPDTTSKFAEEGTAAHELAESILNLEIVGTKAKNGYEFTEEMYEFVQVYVDNIMDYAEGNQLLVEQKVDFSNSINQPDSFGTADAIIIADEGRELQIHDLKYGRGVQVDADENYQLMLYAAGVLDKFSMVGYFDTVRLVIHQPRLYHLSEWSCNVRDIQKFVEEAEINANIAVDNLKGKSDPFLVPGEKQCQWCKAKATCPALQAQVFETVGDDFEDISEAIRQLPNEDNDKLAGYMDLLPVIEGWTKAIYALVEDKLLKGENIRGRKVVQGKKGNRAWGNAEAVEEIMKSMRLKKEEMYDFKLISPTGAEKLLKEESPRRWTRLQDEITRKPGKPCIVTESDRRPAISVTPIADDFDDLT